MKKAGITRALVFALVAVGALVPAPARAVPRNETSCTNTNSGSAGCYFRCIKNHKVTVVVENETNGVVVTGTAKCGGSQGSATTSGFPPPDNQDSNSFVPSKDYAADDSIDPANCFTNNAPGAVIRVTCGPARAPREATGTATAVGTVAFTPGLTLSGPSTAFTLSTTAVDLEVADPFTTRAFVGTATLTATGSSDTSFLSETCLFGEGNVSLALTGTGVPGGISGSGTGRYERVLNELRLVVVLSNLNIGGAVSEPTGFTLISQLAPIGSCVAGPVTSAPFVGTGTLGA